MNTAKLRQKATERAAHHARRGLRALLGAATALAVLGASAAASAQAVAPNIWKIGMLQPDGGLGPIPNTVDASDIQFLLPPDLSPAVPNPFVTGQPNLACAGDGRDAASCVDFIVDSGQAGPYSIVAPSRADGAVPIDGAPFPIEAEWTFGGGNTSPFVGSGLVAVDTGSVPNNPPAPALPAAGVATLAIGLLAAGRYLAARKSRASQR
jgi:hypothetical protein